MNTQKKQNEFSNCVGNITNTNEELIINTTKKTVVKFKNAKMQTIPLIIVS